MASNYSIPTNRKLRGINGIYLGDGWDNLTGGSNGSSQFRVYAIFGNSLFYSARK